MVDIPLAEWLPDRAPLGVPVNVATNVIPWVDGYKPFPSFASYSSNSLTAKFQGGIFARDNAANIYAYAGDATNLYALSSAAWSSVSGGGSLLTEGADTLVTEAGLEITVEGDYTTASDDWWEFIQWGQTVITVNGHTDAPQVITLGGTNFTDLGGSPPKARHIAIVRDFVVLGNINDGTSYPSRVRWSGINNSASWTVSATTQADYQDLQGEGGWVQKIVGGEYGLVFQERAIWRMTYVGSPEIFQFDMIERERGAYAPQSVVGWGNMVFFLADDGFYAMVNGSSAVPIGDGKIDKTFLADYQTGNAHLITGAIDPVNKIVLWAYPGTGFASGSTNQILVYNWTNKKWALVTATIEGFMRYAAQGYTLDTLDTVSSSLDALTSSLDSRAYTGGATSLGAFNSSHTLGTFTGTAMAATVDTGEIELNRGQRTSVQEVRPLVDGMAATVTIGTRNLVSDSVSFGLAISQNSSGFCPARTNANFHRFRLKTSGSFNFMQGLKVKHTSVGGGR